MSLVRGIEVDLERFGLKIGVFEAKIIGAHASSVLQMLDNIENAAKNPVVEGVLSVVLTPAIMSHYPQAITYLDKAITGIASGTQIAADVNGANGTEAKLIIFIKDIQATNATVHSLLLRGLCEQILGMLDNNALQAEVYQYYLAAEQLLKNS